MFYRGPSQSCQPIHPLASASVADEARLDPPDAFIGAGAVLRMVAGHSDRFKACFGAAAIDGRRNRGTRRRWRRMGRGCGGTAVVNALLR
jgi:hypothetical protein